MTASSTLYTLVCFHIFHVLLLLPICSDSHHQCNWQNAFWLINSHRWWSTTVVTMLPSLRFKVLTPPTKRVLMQGGGCDQCKFTYLLASGNGGSAGCADPKTICSLHTSAHWKSQQRGGTSSFPPHCQNQRFSFDETFQSKSVCHWKIKHVSVSRDTQ